MRRLFWVAVGAGATVYALRKVSKVNAVASRLTPSGMAAAVNNLAESLRAASAELRTSMAEHEEALTEALLSGASRRSTESDAWEREFTPDFDDPEQYF